MEEINICVLRPAVKRYWEEIRSLGKKMRLRNVNQAAPPTTIIPKKPIRKTPQFISKPWSGGRVAVGWVGKGVAVSVAEGEGVSVGSGVARDWPISAFSVR